MSRNLFTLFDSGNHDRRDNSVGAWLRRRFVVVLLLAYLLSGVYFVGPEQQAVVVRFGRVAAKGVGPGIHYHAPWPIESVIKLKVLETKRLTVGVEIPDQVLGRTAAENPVEYLTADQNIITAQMSVQYAIKDPAQYLYRSLDVTEMISKAVESAFAQTIASEDVDSLLTTGKTGVQNETLRRSRDILDSYGAGVFISSINIESVKPPDSPSMFIHKPRERHYRTDLDQLIITAVNDTKHKSGYSSIRSDDGDIAENDPCSGTSETCEDDARDKRVGEEAVIGLHSHDQIRNNANRMDGAVADRCECLHAEEKSSNKKIVTRT